MVPAALSDLREDRPQYILKIRIIELQTSSCLRQFFAVFFYNEKQRQRQAKGVNENQA